MDRHFNLEGDEAECKRITGSAAHIAAAAQSVLTPKPFKGNARCAFESFILRLIRRYRKTSPTLWQLKLRLDGYRG